MNDSNLTALTTDLGETVLGLVHRKIPAAGYPALGLGYIDNIQYEEQEVHKQYFDFWIVDAIGGTLYGLLDDSSGSSILNLKTSTRMLRS